MYYTSLRDAMQESTYTPLALTTRSEINYPHHVHYVYSYVAQGGSGVRDFDAKYWITIYSERLRSMKFAQDVRSPTTHILSK